MQPHLVLIRGIPGSGKSTLAKTYTGHIHLENDAYLIQDGKYVWSEERRKEAVRKCMADTREMLMSGNDVVVSNCFIKKASMIPYLQIAKEANAEVEIVTATGDFKTVHDVPEDVILSMKGAFEV